MYSWIYVSPTETSAKGCKFSKGERAVLIYNCIKQKK